MTLAGPVVERAERREPIELEGAVDLGHVEVGFAAEIGGRLPHGALIFQTTDEPRERTPDTQPRSGSLKVALRVIVEHAEGEHFHAADVQEPEVRRGEAVPAL